MWRAPGPRSRPPSQSSAVPCVHRVAVLGAAGFAGALTAAIAERHPRLQLTLVTAPADDDRRLDHIYPRHLVPRVLQPDHPYQGAERAYAPLVADPHVAAPPVVEGLPQ